MTKTGFLLCGVILDFSAGKSTKKLRIPIQELGMVFLILSSSRSSGDQSTWLCTTSALHKVALLISYVVYIGRCFRIYSHISL